MLLQISTVDTVTNISSTGGQAYNTSVLIACIIVIVLLIWFLISRNKSKISSQGEILNPNEKIKNDNLNKAQAFQIINPPKTVIGKKNSETKATTKEVEINIPSKNIIVISEKEEQQSKEKYIGYNPINVFAQSEPLNFPYVIMPKPNCVIKFPRKGRAGRKGYKEEEFKIFLGKYFNNAFQLFDDRFILVKNNNNPYEPDFTLIDEREGINIFLDIEIDEPYEGINDISKRRTTHYQYSDINRNNAFKNRGWIIIRFAEIQIHQEPLSCCLYVADVIKSVNPKYKVPEQLKNIKQVNPVKQWTKEEAEIWSREKYREKYLGITNFGFTEENSRLENINESELDKKIEEKVEEEPVFILPVIKPQTANNSTSYLIQSAKESNEYLSFLYEGKPTIIKPIQITAERLTAFCYVKNIDRVFELSRIKNALKKKSPFTLKATREVLGVEEVKSAVNTAIQYKKFIRIKYTRSAWTDMETGEITTAEESLRTIENVQLAINVLDQKHINQYNLNEEHINAFCNKREKQVTFRFDRISEIEILDI